MRRNSSLNLPTVNHNLARVPAAGQVRREGNGDALPGNNGLAITRKIEQTVAYMREHLDQPLQVANLAALVNVSPSYYFALFKRWTGCAPITYFTHLRMQRACHLLDATSASVKEVAATLGYEDPFYFSRVFKLVNRVPPSRYRTLQQHHGTHPGTQPPRRLKIKPE